VFHTAATTRTYLYGTLAHGRTETDDDGRKEADDDGRKEAVRGGVCPARDTTEPFGSGGR
jgi:hypothetical protein